MPSFMRFRRYLLVTMTLPQLILLIGIQATVTEALENIVRFERSEGSFKCPSTSGNCDGVEWRKVLPTTTSTISRNNIVLDKVDRNRYSVNGSSGCILHIRNVQLEDAGHFDCEYLDNANTMRKSAFLIVLKSSPTCTESVNASRGGEEAEGDGVQLTCELTFSGIDKVSMTWRNLGDVSDPKRDGDNLRLTHSLVANRPKIPSYECVTTFELPKGIIGLAENTPVAPTCVTKEFTLRYPVKTASLSPSLSVYSPGTVISCSSDGNPPPSYKWQIRDTVSDRKSDNWRDIPGETDDNIVVDNATSNFYRCVASNSVRGSTFEAFSEPFQVNYTGNPVGIAIGVTIGIVILLIIVVIVLLYLRVWRKKASMKSNKSSKADDFMPLKPTPNPNKNGSNYSQGIPVASVKPQSQQQQRDTLKRPTDPPPPPLPRENVQKSSPGHPQQREDLVYASIAIDEDPHKMRPKIQTEAPNSDYADITIA